ncbi:MAG: hypothetical protein GY816_10025 [Cytophagales bacterium]|nr:hypothetical protein [Cytophagales bacterium]
MENNPIEVMYTEHDIIIKAENIIDKINTLWEENEQGYVDTVSQLVEFFREYADGYHHRKEEDVLFPAISDHPDFVLQEIIEEFEQHHEDFRDYTKEIVEAIEGKDYSKSHELLREYINDLLDHIAAENEELFVLAESLLDEGELETIFFKFKDIDLELGEDRKAELEKMLII